MKYIVLKRNWHSLFVQELPIIFPEELNHKQIFDSVKNVEGMADALVVSGGFLHILNPPICFGNSDSLLTTSRGAVDAELIRHYINNRGVLDFA